MSDLTALFPRFACFFGGKFMCYASLVRNNPSLSSRNPRFFGREFMRHASCVGGLPALTRNYSLKRWIHDCKSSPALSFANSNSFLRGWCTHSLLLCYGNTATPHASDCFARRFRRLISILSLCDCGSAPVPRERFELSRCCHQWILPARLRLDEKTRSCTVCRWSELNRHGLPHTILSRACIPVPSQRRFLKFLKICGEVKAGGSPSRIPFRHLGINFKYELILSTFYRIVKIQRY